MFLLKELLEIVGRLKLGDMRLLRSSMRMLDKHGSWTRKVATLETTLSDRGPTLRSICHPYRWTSGTGGAL